MTELLAAFGWVLAAGFAGLWWGERGKRRITENWTLRGHPDDRPRAEVHTPTFSAESDDKQTPRPEHGGLNRLASRIRRESGVSQEKAMDEARSLMGQV